METRCRCYLARLAGLILLLTLFSGCRGVKESPELPSPPPGADRPLMVGPVGFHLLEARVRSSVQVSYINHFPAPHHRFVELVTAIENADQPQTWGRAICSSV